MKLRAYYYEFDATESPVIDAVLEAVAGAGKSFHHTENWNESRGDRGTPVEAIQVTANQAACYVKNLEFRLDHLNAWLESRGLPRDWTGPLDAWGWVLYDENGNVAGYDHELSDSCPPGDASMMERWDDAPVNDRAEAIRIEADGTARTNDTERT